MWCIPRVDEAFIARMEDVLDQYAKPYDPNEPILCFDEKSKELHDETRPTQPMTLTRTRRRDYEYRRNGTANVFVTVEPKGAHREVTVTDRRTKQDFAREIKRIVDLPRYRDATTIHVILDNLNTHNASSLREAFGDDVTEQLMKRIRFHHTPKHASWLNMAEIELSIIARQCLNRRIPTKERLMNETTAWTTQRNNKQAMIHWTFTIDDARKVFRDCY